MTSYQIVTNHNCREILLPGKGRVELEDRKAVIELTPNQVAQYEELGARYGYELIELTPKPAASKKVSAAEPETAAKK